MSTKEKISIVIVGHVDSGKSTTTGHLMFANGNIDERTIAKLEAEAKERGKESFKYAYFMDKLSAERERGITIECNQKKFETAKKDFTVIDAPGHRDFIKNMITGTQSADCALVCVPADGGFEAAISKMGTLEEHIMLCYTLGIRQVCVGINKMDAEDYKEARYKEIKENVEKILTRQKFKDLDKIDFVPYSAWAGDNMVKRSENMEWYKGRTLIEALEQFKQPIRPVNDPLRIPLQDIYKISGIGTVPAGRIEAGTLKPGMMLEFAPTAITAECKSVEKHGSSVEFGECGDNVGFNVKLKADELKRGHVASNQKDKPLKGINQFTATVVILRSNGIQVGYKPVICLGTANVACRFDQILKKKSPKESSWTENPQQIVSMDTASISFIPAKTMCAEPFTKCQALGRFAIRDMKYTVGVGVIGAVTEGKVVEAK